jgi:hypothetical protein
MPTVEIGSLKSSGVSERLVFFYANVVGGVLLAQVVVIGANHWGEAVDSVRSSTSKVAATGAQKSPLIVTISRLKWRDRRDLNSRPPA